MYVVHNAFKIIVHVHGVETCVRNGQSNQRHPHKLVHTYTDTQNKNIASDPAIRELLMQLDASMHFIIEILDSNHMFIDESLFDQVQAKLETKLSENVFKPPQ